MADDLVEEILGPEGRLRQRLAGFTFRPEQVEVARALGRAFEQEEICLAEAGTGVGKTMAYLTPALEQIRQGRRIVVSTHTLNLQGQLIRKDIPLLQSALAKPEELQAVLVKGMGNYLCLVNLEFEQNLFARDEILARILEWAGETETGDIAELPFRVRGWSDLGCDRDNCQRADCRHYDRCFYYNMRRSAEEANLIVTNHALFFSDLVIRMSEPGAGILPPYDYVIFDEAHHLEEVATKVFGIEFSNYRITTFLNRLRRLRGVDISPGMLEAVESLNEDLFRPFGAARKQEFFLQDVLERPAQQEVNSAASQLVILLKELHAAITGAAREAEDEDERLRDRLQGYGRTCARLAGDLQTLLFEEDSDWFVWGEKPAQPGRLVWCVLHRTPLKIADILQEQFWGKFRGAALVSATLSNSGGFSYVRSRLGIREGREVVVGSPFDFRSQCLLYVPAHLPFPSHAPEYVEALASEIERLIGYSGGRAFLLFTSYRMLETVYEALSARLDYPLLRQGEMPNAALLEEFRRLPNACLFGTSSFWEGVDVQGEALSCVIIDKLPFSVPDSPMSRARIAAVEEAGGNAFSELSVPEAQIRLKQGFGRLIRTASDRGVVAIFDSRLYKKSYGASFLSVLPPARLTRSLDEVRRFFSK